MDNEKSTELPSPEELEAMYSPDGDGEHPAYPREEWRDAVNDEETVSGYWVWVHRVLTEETEAAIGAPGYDDSACKMYVQLHSDSTVAPLVLGPFASVSVDRDGMVMHGPGGECMGCAEFATRSGASKYKGKWYTGVTISMESE